MNTFEIESTLESLLYFTKLNLPFHVIAANELKSLNITSYPSIIIQNCDILGQPGSHWIAYYVTSKNTTEYFDSYGNDINMYPNVQVPGKIVKENCIPLQPSNSEACGHFAIFYVYHRAIGVKYKHILNILSKSRRGNEKIVRQFICNVSKNCHFNSNSNCNQCCKSRIKNKF